MEDKIVVVEVTTCRHRHFFWEFARGLYRGEERWVAPLEEGVEAIFNHAKNPLFERGGARRWLAYSAQGECVGRIAAFYTLPCGGDEELRVGGCGFFESIDSQSVASVLFDTAREWLASMGFEAMDGSINFGSRDAWWGVLTRGFEHEPLMNNNYNFPYYANLFENYGFRVYFKQYSYRWRMGLESLNERVERRSERLLKGGRYSARALTSAQRGEAVGWITSIYNQAWREFPSIEPLCEADVEILFRSLEPIIDYNMLIFAFNGDKPIGFLIAIPDINRIISDFDGHLNLWTKLLLWWRLRVLKSCDRLFGMLFGVVPTHQARGVESLMITTLRDGYLLKASGGHYRSLEFAWIGDFNPVMMKMMECYVGAECHKEHTTYRLMFDKNRAFKRHSVLKKG